MGVPHSDNCVKVSLKNKIVFIASIKRWRLHNHLDLLFGLSVLCLFVSYITGKRMADFNIKISRKVWTWCNKQFEAFWGCYVFFYFLRLFCAPQTGRGGGMRSRSASCSMETQTLKTDVQNAHFAVTGVTGDFLYANLWYPQWAKVGVM